MADGDYERRAAHDAELKRLERIIRQGRERAKAQVGSPDACADAAICDNISPPIPNVKGNDP